MSHTCDEYCDCNCAHCLETRLRQEEEAFPEEAALPEHPHTAALRALVEHLESWRSGHGRSFDPLVVDARKLIGGDAKSKLYTAPRRALLGGAR